MTTSSRDHHAERTFASDEGLGRPRPASSASPRTPGDGRTSAEARRSSQSTAGAMPLMDQTTPAVIGRAFAVEPAVIDK